MLSEDERAELVRLRKENAEPTMERVLKSSRFVLVSVLRGQCPWLSV